MPIVEINEELYEQVRKIVEICKVDYPSIKNFIDRAVREKVKIDMIREKEAEIKRKKWDDCFI